MALNAWHYQASTGRVSGIRYCHSPNADERPADTTIDLIVIHGISLPPAQFGGEYVELFFQNRLPIDRHPFFSTIATLKVSSHFFIDRLGEVVQFVPVTQRAWHAGVSTWEGRTHCNDYSIGIELEGTDEIPYTSQQYSCLIRLCQLLQSAFPQIGTERIVGHHQIAPERKTDPGEAFDWARLQQALNKQKEYA